MKQYLSINVIIPFCLMVLGILWLIAAQELPASSKVTLFAGPSTFPTLILSILIFLSLIITIQEVRNINKHATEPVRRIAKEDLLLVIALVGALLGYILIVTIITFIPATIALMLAGMLLFGQRKMSTLFIVSVVVPLVVYAIFEYGLKINLP